MVRVAIADEDVGAGRWGWCHGLLRSRSVRRRSISPTPLEQTEVLSRLQPEWRISGWSASGQSKRPPGAAAEPPAWRGGSHGPGAGVPRSRTPTPLYGSRDGTPDTCRPQPEQIYQDRNSFPADRRRIPCPETAPSFSNAGTRQKICDRGRRLRVPELAALANSSVAIQRFRDQSMAWQGGVGCRCGCERGDGNNVRPVRAPNLAPPRSLVTMDRAGSGRCHNGRRGTPELWAAHGADADCSRSMPMVFEDGITVSTAPSVPSGGVAALKRSLENPSPTGG